MARVDELPRRNPLVRFSPYTHIQTEFLRRRGRAILELMDHSTPAGEHPNLTQDVYAEFWLWTLGAYEVVRLVHRSPGCFAPGVLEVIQALHDSALRPLRMVFAKQERAFGAGDADADASVYGFGPAGKDLLFKLDGKVELVVSARDLLRRFDEVFAAIRPEDVFMDFRDRVKAKA